MASDVVYSAIRNYLEGVNATPAAWATTPIQWENDKPVKMINDAGEQTPWIMVEMAGTLYAQESIGAGEQAQNRWDEEGQLFIHVFTPSGTGGLLARQYAKQIADLFRGAHLPPNESIEFMDASIGEGSPGDDTGDWFRISVEIKWRRIEA